MVFLYLENGDVDKASVIVTRLLKEDPDDLEMLTAGAEIYLSRGRPDRAIHSFERIKAQQPENLKVLRKLAQTYEWSVMPRKAAEVWARIAELTPDDPAPLEKLVLFYRFFDMLHKEVDAIVRLNSIKDKEKYPTVLHEGISRAVNRLAAEFDATRDDPYLDYLIRGIYVVGEQFSSALEEEEKVNYLEYVTYVLEYYLSMDRFDGAREFASWMDSEKGGIESRVQLVRVLGWGGYYNRAMALAEDLRKIEPDNVVLLREIAWMSRAQGRLDLAESALKGLVRLEPDNDAHREDLGNVYIEGGKFAEAVDVFRKLAKRAEDFLRHVHSMLRAALFSSDRNLMAEVVSETESIESDDPQFLRTKAELYLNLERSRDAYDELFKLAKSSGAERGDYQRLLDAAAATAEARLVGEATELALDFAPDDPSILRSAAEAWLAAGDAEESYSLYRRLAVMERREDDVLAMLIAASDTQRLETAKDAGELAVRLLPENLKVVVQAGEIMLWLGVPKQGYPYFKKAAAMSGGDRDYVTRMIEVASFTEDPKYFRDAARESVELRPDDSEVAMLAAGVWAAAGDPAKASALVERFAGRGGGAYASLLKWARFADRNGLTEEAYRLYDRLYDLRPGDHEVGKNLARLAGWTSRPEVAARVYGDLSDNSPRSFKLAVQAGEASSDAGLYENAVRYYRRALELKPGDDELRLVLARNYGYAGNIAKRLELLEQLHQKGILSQSDRMELARAYVDNGKPRKALDILEPFEKINPLPQFEGFLLASALDRSGQGARAVEIYRRLLREYREDSEFMARLGAEAFFGDHQDTALSLFRAALKGDPDNATALKGAAILYAEKDDLRQALRFFRKYNKMVPDDADARYRLGEVYTRLGRDGQAYRQYNRARRILKRNNTKQP